MHIRELFEAIGPNNKFGKSALGSFPLTPSERQLADKGGIGSVSLPVPTIQNLINGNIESVKTKKLMKAWRQIDRMKLIADLPGDEYEDKLIVLAVNYLITQGDVTLSDFQHYLEKKANLPREYARVLYSFANRILAQYREVDSRKLVKFDHARKRRIATAAQVAVRLGGYQVVWLTDFTELGDDGTFTREGQLTVKPGTSRPKSLEWAYEQLSKIPELDACNPIDDKGRFWAVAYVANSSDDA